MGGFSARNVCVTLNNPKNKMEIINSNVRYAVWQLEEGESGTPHYQMYLEFNDKLTMPKIKAIVGESAHIEARRGTREQARAYCMKEDSRIEGPWEHGVWNKNGAGNRTDLDDVAEMIKERMSLRDIAVESTVAYIKFSKGIEKAHALINCGPRDVNTPPKVEWIYGKTGTGKTRYAYNNYGNDVYIKDNTKWWDGYTQQRVIIIDDFDGTWPYRNLLRLLDRYPYQGEFKGGYVNVNSPHIVITADRRPEAIYHDLDRDEISQLLRRINFINELRGSGSEVGGNTNPPPLDDRESTDDI